MKKLRNMKKNNKGFSLVELIVVIAIMAVLVAVLGSAILGYIEDANYESDRTALKSAETAIEAYIAEGNVYNFDGNLSELMTADTDGTIAAATAEIFNADGTFNNSSDAFEDIDTADITIVITAGNLYMLVPSSEADFDDYESGVEPAADAS